MRQLLARYIIRRVWRLGRDWTALDYLGACRREDVVFNVSTLITTALGGHSGWIPDDVENEWWERRMYYLGRRSELRS